MTDYRRIHMKGKTSFFTVVTYNRMPLFSNRPAVDTLRSSIRKTHQKYPFDLEAICILPDHLHCIWTLPEEDERSGLRWASIKSRFSRLFAQHQQMEKPASESRAKRRESGYWQRRFWEHVIISEEDYIKHFDYIHYNPVKHGLTEKPGEWEWSTFRKYVQTGVYDEEWNPYSPLNTDDEFGE